MGQLTILLTFGGVLLSLSLSIHLFILRRGPAANFLALYMLSVCIILLEPAIPLAAGHSLWIGQLFIGAFTFVTGPALFHYCKFRLTQSKFRLGLLWHYVPAFMVFILMSITPESTINEGGADEVILYLIFVLQILSYAYLSFRIVKKVASQIFISQFHLVFVRLLLGAHVSVFVYSFLSTLIRSNVSSVFIDSIQILLNVIIIVVALFNAEGLEKRKSISL